MRRFLLCAVLAVLPIAAAAATLTPSLVLANPSMYDGKVITVSGTVKDFTTRNTDLGNFTKFKLCDPSNASPTGGAPAAPAPMQTATSGKTCITVIDKTKQAHDNKSTVTVNGTWRASFKGPHKTWTNTLTIGF